MKNKDKKHCKFISSLEFVVLDIETTGLDKFNDEIIEIAALYISDGKIVDKYSTFVKPSKTVSPFIKKLTGITDEMLAYGIAVRDALDDLIKFVGEKTLVCHNAGFDIEFIKTKMLDNGLGLLTNKVYDTLTLSQIYITDSVNHKLETMCDYFGIDLTGAHRAINDAEATGWLMLELIDFIFLNIDYKTNNLLYEMGTKAREYSDLSHLLNKIVDEQKTTVLVEDQKPEFKLHDFTYINHQFEKDEITQLKDIFGKEGLLSTVYENYEFREGQLRMAEVVKSSLEDEKHLLVEAGTGVGKSLAYLIPALQYAKTNNCKVVISTNTKNLQEQIFAKDLPLLTKCLPISFKAVLLKGRGNYICEKKWQEMLNSWQRTASDWELKDLMRLVVWKKFTQTGDIVENTSFNTGKMSAAWKRVVADRHYCGGKNCQYFGRCYYMGKRMLANNAELVVINHHLLLADAVNKNAALGEYSKLIIDEAHNLPNTAHTELGFSLSWPDVNSFFSQMFQIRKEHQSGELVSLKKSLDLSKINSEQKNTIKTDIEVLINILVESKDNISPFFWEMGKMVKKCTAFGKLSYYQDQNEYKRSRLEAMPDFSFMNMAEAVTSCFEVIRNYVKKLSKHLETIEPTWLSNYETHVDMTGRAQERLTGFIDQIEAFMQPDHNASAYWFSVLNIDDNEYPAGVLNLVPLDISQQMSEFFYNKLDSIIFTSATLAIRGIFKYYERRMGITLAESDKIRLEVVDSPFDYGKQSLVLDASYLPNYQDRFFFPQSISFICQSCQKVPGGTLVLFTSYKDMEKAYRELSEQLPKEIKLMVQSRTTSRSALLKQFKRDGRGVLLGTSSFWEGVDVPGEALSQIIIFKLPFPSPGDPVVEAYTKKLTREKKPPFDYYTLPEALLKYRQGYGRLIRSQKDTGVIVVLDNRIATKLNRYGKYFIQVLPSETIFCHTPEEALSRIGRWFMEKKFSTIKKD